MKKIIILLIVLVALLTGYAAIQWYSQPDEFVSPADFRTDLWKDEIIDEFRLVFANEKQLVVKEEDGGWQADDFPADPEKITEFFNKLGAAEITSRVSTNSQNHQRFEVDGQGIELAMIDNDEIVQKMIIGKSAGGNSIYVRLPEQDDVYVLLGITKLFFTEDVKGWVDRKVATFSAANIRLVNYEEGPVNWEASKLSGEWKLQTTTISPVSIDSTKLQKWLVQIVSLTAIDLLDSEQVTAAKENDQLATATIELGTTEEFEQKIIWQIYAGDDEDRLFVFRDEDEIGYEVVEQSVNDIFSDYAQTKTNLIADGEPAAVE